MQPIESGNTRFCNITRILAHYTWSVLYHPEPCPLHMDCLILSWPVSFTNEVSYIIQTHLLYTCSVFCHPDSSPLHMECLISSWPVSFIWGVLYHPDPCPSYMTFLYHPDPCPLHIMCLISPRPLSFTHNVSFIIQTHVLYIWSVFGWHEAMIISTLRLTTLPKTFPHIM